MKKKVSVKPVAKKVVRKKVATSAKKASEKSDKAGSSVKPDGALPHGLAGSIGTVTHYYGGIKVAIVKLSKPVKVGTAVRFLGATTDFAQQIQSLQFDHKDIASAPKGKEVGTKVKKRVREGDQVFLVE